MYIDILLYSKLEKCENKLLYPCFCSPSPVAPCTLYIYMLHVMLVKEKKEEEEAPV